MIQTFCNKKCSRSEHSQTRNRYFPKFWNNPWFCLKTPLFALCMVIWAKGLFGGLREFKIKDQVSRNIWIKFLKILKKNIVWPNSIKNVHGFAWSRNPQMIFFHTNINQKKYTLILGIEVDIIFVCFSIKLSDHYFSFIMLNLVCTSRFSHNRVEARPKTSDDF